VLEPDAGHATLGGFDPPISLSRQESALLAAVADLLVPEGAGFPAPSAVGVVDFIARYVTPRDRPVMHYPFAAEDEFKRSLAGLGRAFLDADPSRRVELLRRLEVEEAAFFAQVRDLVYYGYYSRPAVIQAIRDHVEAGRDYHGPPQPYGYDATLEGWDDIALPSRRGRYTATEDVRRASPMP